MIDRPTDVLIIGAGIAGLSAARHLTEAGLRVKLLEARNRLGGRIYTQQTAQYPVEMGAEFIHGRPQEILGLAAEAGVPIVPIQGNFRRKTHGVWADAADMMEQVSQLFAEMSADEPDQSFQSYIDHSTASYEAKQQALRYVGGFHAANPALISVHSLIRDGRAEEAIDGDHQYRVATGYENLVRAMADRIIQQRCDILMETIVKEIVWRKDAVVARTATAEFHATRAIISLPLGVLQSASITFSPPMPEKQKAMRLLEMGSVVRVSLCFSEKFWERDAEMASLSFLLTDDTQFPTWWTSNPLPYPILTAWAAGSHALAHSGQGKDQIVNSAVQALGRIMGIDDRELHQHMIGSFTHDWQADPFSCGAYSYAAAGGIDAAAVLAAPVADTLYFAGEATNRDGYNGTVHGAIATGIRAAQELLQSW
jgi:monoamine oxidase